MIAIPAIDLREGACVQLVGGEYAQEKVRLDDPVAVARKWQALGFHTLHIVDLDAATGKGSNLETVAKLLALPDLDFQVGGGVRSRERIADLLAAGAARVIVGTRAIEEPAWLAEMARTYPDKLVVAADVRGRSVLTRGWQAQTSKDIGELLDELGQLPLAGVLVTAVHKEGQLSGTDLSLMEEVARRSRFPTLASGGVTTLQDLRDLKTRKVAGAVIGMALYTGAIDAQALAKEFA
jgi:phosphoribosylformimino-5-aminoimidazole carboxamide ribotide isomerase